MNNEEGEEPAAIWKVRCLGETTLALKILRGFSGGVLWVPKSVVHDDSEVWKEGHAGNLVVKSWWAEKEGL